MRNNLMPLHIDGITESIYSGFGARLGSWILDFIFILPVLLLTTYLNGLGKNIYFYTLVPNLLFTVWYNIYLPIKNGGTPGKTIAGLEIIKMNGQPIGWKEAILRNSLMLALTLLSYVLMTSSLIEADNATYVSLSWLKRSQYLNGFSPICYKVYAWASNIWILSELVVLLITKRKRAIHDYMAGTVLVKARYADDILETMQQTIDNTEDANGIDLLPYYAG